MLHVRAARKRKIAKVSTPARWAIEPDRYGVFGDAAILRSLILFNALFAVQTGLDIAYLWGGVALPEGMSYAAYAHRGAYPLVVTALLAAAFVLLAMRPGAVSERNRMIRPLVLAWITQNIALMLRLDLYVEAYSLTGLRLAAFVWMLLVAIGLVLILIQIAKRKSAGWLVSANAAALALALYASCFVNTPAVIANYNFRHSQELRGAGSRLDIAYLKSLGPQAIPAIDRYAPRIAAVDRARPYSAWVHQANALAHRRERMASWHRAEQADWRAWGFRAWRLSRYLANTPKLRSRAPAARPHPAHGRHVAMAPRILVVDDDSHIRDVICFALEKAGMATGIARDGVQALESFRRQPADLVILDMACRRWTGWRSAASCARPPMRRSCSSRRGTRRSTGFSASRSAATIMLQNRSARANSWRGSM